MGEIRSVFTDKEISEAFKGTMAYSVLSAHSAYGAYRGDNLNIRFDAIASHDITYVGIIQSAKASGLKRFPLPYVLTNCHNSLCAVGGTINEDDHVFGLSAAKKYGGVYVPANVAVIHSFMREKFAGCGLRLPPLSFRSHRKRPHRFSAPVPLRRQCSARSR